MLNGADAEKSTSRPDRNSRGLPLSSTTRLGIEEVRVQHRKKGHRAPYADNVSYLMSQAERARGLAASAHRPRW